MNFSVVKVNIKKNNKMSTWKGENMKTDVYMLKLWNRGVSEWLLFNVKRSNSSAISCRDRLQFVVPMMWLGI
jgi:hypothetical protein